MHGYIMPFNTTLENQASFTYHIYGKNKDKKTLIKNVLYKGLCWFGTNIEYDEENKIFYHDDAHIIIDPCYQMSKLLTKKMEEWVEQNAKLLPNLNIYKAGDELIPYEAVVSEDVKKVIEKLVVEVCEKI